MQRFIANVKARFKAMQNWTGKPGYAGFGLLGLGTFISGARHDQGMGFLLVAALLAFVGEKMQEKKK